MTSTIVGARSSCSVHVCAHLHVCECVAFSAYAKGAATHPGTRHGRTRISFKKGTKLKADCPRTLPICISVFCVSVRACSSVLLSASANVSEGDFACTFQKSVVVVVACQLFCVQH